MGQFLQGTVSFVPTLLIAIVVFGALIFIHELGHFLTAKWSGIKVNEFSIGMGLKLWGRQKGETLYALRLLPIGGYVSMEGEDEESDEPRAFQRAARVEAHHRHGCRRGDEPCAGLYRSAHCGMPSGADCQPYSIRLSGKCGLSAKRPAAGRHYRGGER